MSDLARLREDHPYWRIHATWASAASGPDRRQFQARRAGVTVQAWSAAALAERIAEQDRQLATRN
jgi:hypothetical protein